MLVLAAVLSAIPSAPAVADRGQESWLEDDGSLMADPAGTLAQMRMIGVDRLRVAVRWQLIAPKPMSRRRPRNFNGADPGSYPPGTWNVWDAIVTEATQQGISLNFDLLGGAPMWAQGPGKPHDGLPHLNWEPNPADFGKFVRAVATRYSGNYDPGTNKIDPGNPDDLPRVNFWSVWNEPDYGPSLAPQGVPGHLRVENSPRMYRNLVNAMWSALHATGHARDSFVIGELAPRGASFWGVFSGMKPMIFLRAMYCVDSRYRPLRRSAAAIRGCPTSAAGSRQFRKRNPGLFSATGLADHPYMRWYPPNKEQFPDPNYTTLGQIGNLTRGLDRLQRVYGSRARIPVYNTEFGYITTPPKRDTRDRPWVSQSTASYYLNWAEYISWRNPRIRSFSQYLLYDPLPATADDDFGGFASGLLNFAKHTPKATYAAWRMPLYLPVTSTRRGRAMEVWGCARPAHLALADTGQAQSVRILFQRGSRGAFTTLQTVPITDPHGYFDVRVRFPASGTVMLAWSYPAADPMLGSFDPVSTHQAFSRRVRVTVR